MKSFSHRPEMYSKHMDLDQSVEDLDDGLEFDLEMFREFLRDPNKSIVGKNPLTGKVEYACPKCGKVYSYPSTLLRHLKFECGKLPKFQCPHCSYRAHRKENIKSHVIAKHEKGKKMKCPHCIKTFVHKFRLLEHVRIFHADMDEFLFPLTPIQNDLPPKEETCEFNMELTPGTTISYHPQNVMVVDSFGQSKLSTTSEQKYFNKPISSSTPKKRGRPPKVLAVMEIPSVTQLGQINASTATEEATQPSVNKEESQLENDADRTIKEENSLDITDSVDPLAMPNPGYCQEDVLRVIL